MRRADRGNLNQDELNKAMLLLRMYSLDHARPKTKKDYGRSSLQVERQTLFQH